MDDAELESVAPELYEVVEQGAESGQRGCAREQRHVPELDKHLQVVVKCTVVLK